MTEEQIKIARSIAEDKAADVAGKMEVKFQKQVFKDAGLKNNIHTRNAFRLGLYTATYINLSKDIE